MVDETQNVSKVDYTYVGKNENEEAKPKKFKKILMPGKRMINGFVLILLIVLINAAMKFPLGSFISGNLSASVPVGFPLTFLNFELSGASSLFNYINLTLDIIIWIIASYLINIILNLISKIKIFEKKSSTEEQPTIFKDQKIATTEKIVGKIIG